MKNKTIVSIVFASTMILTGCQGSKLLTLKPQVWEGDEYKASVTRGAYQTTFDTAEVANAHCAQYGKMAKLVEEVNIFEFPNTDKYACVKPS